MAKKYEIHLRIDEVTKDVLIRSAAKKQNSETPNISRYIRDLIMAHGETMTQELALELHATRNQIKRIGNNINQLARVANETGNAPDADRIIAELNKVNDEFDRIREEVYTKLN